MLDAVATVILAGMMFIPIINLVVGIILALDASDVFGGKLRVANGRHRRLGLALTNRHPAKP